MRKIWRIAGLVALLGGLMTTVVWAGPKPAGGDGPAKDFKVFDNMAYKGQPDLSKFGLIHSDIITDVHPKAGHMPDEQKVKDEVTKKLGGKPGVLVYDIEDSNDWAAFVTLVQWAHEAVPGCVVGFYAHGMETKALANAVDAFFPEAYTFNDNRAGWKNTLMGAIRKAHNMAPGKPVYPYLWPQYHHGTAKSWQFVAGDYWAFQLQTARESGADGVVLWGYSVLKGTPQKPWSDDAPWWQETLKFMGELKKS